MQDLFRAVDRDGFKARVIRADNEIFKYPTIKELLRTKNVRREPSPANTQALNGLAESSGGEVIRRSRCMRLSSHLPENMWPLICMAASYLVNRSPKQNKGWHKPIGMSRLNEIRAGGIQQDYKPSLAHLKVYDCLAYAMTSDAQLKHHRKQRMQPRVNIGWLVGYTSTNIYRIWIPKQKRVVSMRDVLFDEGRVFTPDFDPFPNDDRQALEEYVNENEIRGYQGESDDDDILSVIVVQPRHQDSPYDSGSDTRSAVQCQYQILPVTTPWTNLSIPMKPQQLRIHVTK